MIFVKFVLVQEKSSRDYRSDFTIAGTLTEQDAIILLFNGVSQAVKKNVWTIVTQAGN